MSGITGFMLGRAMSHNDRPYYPPNSNGANPSNITYDDLSPRGSGFLRFLAWLTVIALIGGGVWYFVRRSRQNTSTARNYSL